jgi:hypothetical protein
MKELLIELGACQEAKVWAGNKLWPEIYQTCHRGDWLLWLFVRVNPYNKRELTLAKGHCANTVRHLMTDVFIDAVDAAIAYGEGRIDDEELRVFAERSIVAFNRRIYTNCSSSIAADSAACDIASIAYRAAVYASFALTYQSEREESLAKTANICRDLLPIEIWNINEPTIQTAQ